MSVLGILVVGSLFATSSGDWDSESGYVSDMRSSYSGITNIRDNVGNTIYAYENDSYTLMEDVEEEASEGQSSLDTHVDYFEGTTPPAGYGEYHRLTLAAWDVFDEALLTIENGYYYGDFELIDEGIDMMDDFYTLVEDAEETLPESEEADRLRDVPLTDDFSDTTI
jgi:hypothetical protein